MFVSAVSAYQGYCVDLEVNDITCEGYRTNWPTKVCSFTDATFPSASYCDSAANGFPRYRFWSDFCPLKNTGNASFCEGKGYAFAHIVYPYPCFGLVGCSSNSDCNFESAPAPVAPVAPPPLMCYDCCTFCFEDSLCQEKVAYGSVFTNSTICTDCKAIAPVTTPSGSDTPVVPPVTLWPNKITTTVTIKLKVAISFADLNRLVDELATALDLPVAAIPLINIDTDRSTVNTTVVEFVIESVQREDGSIVDPIAAARELRLLIESNDP